MGCGDYRCGTGAACLTTCTGDGDCVTGETCQGGSCTSLTPNGQSCVMNADCISAHCAQGVCCNQACGGCSSCVITGSVGTCVPFPAGNDPSGACTASCGAGSTLNQASTCDGSGACVPMTMDCAPYACASGACRTDCAGPADCAAGASCVGNKCM
jgi:hypothetical protein